MKKIGLYILWIALILIMVGCGSTAVSEKPMANQTSVASLSYISTGLMEAEMKLYEEEPGSSVVRFLSKQLLAPPEETTVFEGELEYVNIYMDKLKLFMNDGFDSIDVEDTTSDNEEYIFMFTFNVEEESYKIYYNVDEETGEVTGILISNDIEYDLIITDDTIEEDDEVIRDIVMTATNGEDFIITSLKTVTEEAEVKQVISIEKSISGNESELEIIIKDDVDSTFSVQINDGVNEYKFKVETTEEGKHYKLDYEIEGVKGFVLINELTDENGEIYYRYKIQETGKDEVEVEKEKPEKPEKKDKNENNPNA